jgi:hypothetical protein
MPSRIIEIDGVPHETVRWTESCSGCLETNEGVVPAGYEWDEKARCHRGTGCRECGYTGKRRRCELVPVSQST